MKKFEVWVEGSELRGGFWVEDITVDHFSVEGLKKNARSVAKRVMSEINDSETMTASRFVIEESYRPGNRIES